MESNDELKEIDIKNRMCYYLCYFKIEDFHSDNILLDEKSCENIWVCDISCKTLIDSKPLRISLEKGFDIRIYDGTRHIVLFGREKYNAIYKSVR